MYLVQAKSHSTSNFTFIHACSLSGTIMPSRFVRGKSFADAKGGAVSSRSKIVAEKDNDASLVPPVIRQLPTAGDGAVAVTFEHNSHDGSRKQHKQQRHHYHQRRLLNESEDESGKYELLVDGEEHADQEDVFANSSRRQLGSTSSSSSSSVGLRRVFVVTSSPGSFTATGNGSPIVVRGLTNGVAYTFSVQAEVEDARGVRRSASSAGSEAVVPGCGAHLALDLLSVEDPEPPQAPRSSSQGSGNGGGDVDLFDSMEESSSSNQGRSGCQHGVCALDGVLNADRCFCDVGYAGSVCEKNENVPEGVEGQGSSSDAVATSSSATSVSATARRSRSLAPQGSHERDSQRYWRRGGNEELSSSSTDSASFLNSAAASRGEKSSTGVSFATLLVSVALAAFGGVAMGLMLANSSTKQDRRSPERLGGGELPSAYA